MVDELCDAHILVFFLEVKTAIAFITNAVIDAIRSNIA
jgi:hypothetical protein